MKRIDLFMPPRSRYGVLQHFTTEFMEAIRRQGVETRLLMAQKDNPAPFLQSIFSDPPECTLSFNGLLPDANGQFFCDLIKIPHVACLVDAPVHFYPLTQSPLNIITCPDLFSCEFFKGLNCDNVLFMPHGVDRDLAPDPDLPRKHDVVMLASCINFEKIRREWKDKYSKELCAVLDDAAERTLSDQTTPYVEAFAQAINAQLDTPSALDPKTFNIFDVLTQLEMYIRGKDRFMLLTAVQDVTVDVFGVCGKNEGWEACLCGKKTNCRCVGPVSYEEALEVMKQSKIVLNSCPWIKNGGHERLFAGMACEALVITNENIFTREHFEDGKDLVTYQHGHWDKVNEQVNSYLADEEKRTAVAKSGRESVMAAHTWDHRAATLLKELAPIVERIRKNLESTTSH